MKVRSILYRLMALATVVGLLFVHPAEASTAQNVVRDFYTHLETTMKQGKPLGFQGRYKKLAPVIETTFDLPLMAKMATGLGWRAASEKDQQDLVMAFSAFSISTYASRFTDYDGEKFTIMGEKPSTNGVIVETTLKPKEGNAVTLNYLLRPNKKGAYKIVDVYMNGTISELATRRGEFSSIVRDEGVPALVKSLEEKAKQMESL